MSTDVFLFFPFPSVCGVALCDFHDSTQCHACASCTPAKASILVQESLSNLTLELADSALIAQFGPNLLQLLILYLLRNDSIQRPTAARDSMSVTDYEAN